jgi:D-alanyl-D-alanine-carboxypeptidase/D-alanyl-D-alanine-endopeptidase
MLTFAGANLGLTQTPLKGAMDAALAARSPVNSPSGPQALGWGIHKTPIGDIATKNGGTGGFRTMIALNLATKTGVVVLTNAANEVGADDIALHLISGAPLSPLAPPGTPPDERQAVAMDPAKFDAFVGRYRLAPSVTIEITRKGDHLLAQLTGQPANEIFPAGDTEFFWKVVDAQLTFDPGADGRAKSLVLHQAGRNLPAARLP